MINAYPIGAFALHSPSAAALLDPCFVLLGSGLPDYRAWGVAVASVTLALLTRTPGLRAGSDTEILLETAFQVCRHSNPAIRRISQIGQWTALR